MLQVQHPRPRGPHVARPAISRQGEGRVIRMVTKYKNRIAVRAAISSVGIGRVATFTARIPSCYSSSTRQDTGTILRLQHLGF